MALFVCVKKTWSVVLINSDHEAQYKRVAMHASALLGHVSSHIFTGHDLQGQCSKSLGL